MLVAFITLAILFRLGTLFISIRNERRLKAQGAVEIGATNSSVLALAHTAFYLAAIGEAFLRPVPMSDVATVTGVAFYLFGAAMLVIVIYMLGRFWTVKLIIAHDHVLVTNSLFTWVRHPNYYLNIIPELLGFALTLHAFNTLLLGLPLYLIPLVIRIMQEEKAMQTKFAAY